MGALAEEYNTAVTQRNFDLRLEHKIYDLRTKGFRSNEQIVWELKCVGVPITDEEVFTKAYLENGGNRKWKLLRK